MSKLTTLRDRLAELRRSRQRARWGTAYAAVALAVLWLMALAFVIDYTFEFTRVQRLLVLVIFAAATAWAVRRFALPWLGHHESDLDMALLVEKQEGIDNDLVAALQFEQPDAHRGGSRQLEQAVIDYVAEFGKGWDVFAGFSRRELNRRGALLLCTVAALGVAVFLAPRYAGVFLNRFLLGSQHYPSNTVIERVLVNGRSIDVTPGSDVIINSPYGRPLKFVVYSSGAEPKQSRADLRTVNGGTETRVELEPQDMSPAVESRPDAAASGAALAGQLPKLIDTVDCQLYVGDAWTDPLRVQVVPLPVVQPQLTATPPSYAQAAVADVPQGSRQISVVEGSRVDFQLTCSNKKLKQAVVSIDGNDYSLARTAAAPATDGSRPDAAAGETWTLDVAPTPLANVTRPTRWELKVVDEDDLELEHPIEGFLRIKADQRPRISADVVTKFVLPTASPLIELRAGDDYGLSKILLHCEATRVDGTMPEIAPEVVSDRRILSDQLPLKMTYALNLSPLKLAKGDQLKITLEAIDYRGTSPGQSTVSEPLILQVTDESGVLAAISESDERSARQLDAIILRNSALEARNETACPEKHLDGCGAVDWFVRGQRVGGIVRRRSPVVGRRSRGE